MRAMHCLFESIAREVKASSRPVAAKSSSNTYFDENLDENEDEEPQVAADVDSVPMQPTKSFVVKCSYAPVTRSPLNTCQLFRPLPIVFTLSINIFTSICLSIVLLDSK